MPAPMATMAGADTEERTSSSGWTPLPTGCCTRPACCTGCACSTSGERCQHAGAGKDSAPPRAVEAFWPATCSWFSGCMPSTAIATHHRCACHAPRRDWCLANLSLYEPGCPPPPFDARGLRDYRVGWLELLTLRSGAAARMRYHRCVCRQGQGGRCPACSRAGVGIMLQHISWPALLPCPDEPPGCRIVQGDAAAGARRPVSRGATSPWGRAGAGGRGGDGDAPHR